MMGAQQLIELMSAKGYCENCLTDATEFWAEMGIAHCNDDGELYIDEE